MNTHEIRERLVGIGDPKQAPISVAELTKLLEIVDTSSYSVVFTQIIAPEYGDGEDFWYVQKEFLLPFIPSHERVGFILPDLGPYVIFTNWSHYDLNDRKFYVTINANWVQVWKDNAYDQVETLMKLEKQLDRLKKLGWKTVKKTPETF